MSEPGTIEPPPWALSLVDERTTTVTTWASRPDGLRQRRTTGAGLALLSLAVPDAASLDEHAFRRQTAHLYEELLEAASAESTLSPTRIWNVIPGILEPLGGLRHRYMAFNAGRHDAYLRRYDTEAGLAAHAPTATAVGSRGRDLVVHVLATAEPGRAFENPRQVPAREYSTRYGPRPPCFARATRVDRVPARWLLVGGTASVVGEETRHPNDVEAQLAETACNLRALLTAADADHATAKSVRVYHPRSEDETVLRTTVGERLGTTAGIELVQAELCRPELLVEIEALYTYPARPETASA